MERIKYIISGKADQHAGILKNSNRAKSRRLQKLVEMSYDLSAVGTDSDAIFLEKVIEQEKDSELKEAFEDLDDYLFNW